KKCAALPGFLKDVALEWYRETPLEIRLRWMDVAEALRRFFKPVDPEFYLQKLEQRMRLKEEPLTTYAIAVSSLCRKVDPLMGESRKVHYFVRGLNVELKEQIMYQRFESLSRA